MKQNKRIALGADHRGCQLRSSLISYLKESYAVLDCGTESEDSVDYPDYADKVARLISSGEADFGILICNSGVGMSIAANRWSGVRAANLSSEAEVSAARKHNNINVLSLAAEKVDLETAKKLIQIFLNEKFEEGRHMQRVEKSSGNILLARDVEVYKAIEEEGVRQKRNIELIASENFTSLAVMETQGSLLTNKYAEGYPGKRWYGGCDFVDKIESLALTRVKKLFEAEHANVQPHSGAQANMAVCLSALNPGDSILSMDLAHGGHLSHGHPANFSGKIYNVTHYGVRREDHLIDYDALEKQAEEVRPKLIIGGASAYPRQIDFERMGNIAKKVGALLLVDMAHIAGLVAAKVHPSPIPHADFVTSTTHKSLRGPRGGIILCKEEFAKKIDSNVFPGVQGGPLMHVIAGKAVCFKEAFCSEFVEYQKQVIMNSQALSKRLIEHGYSILTGGSDNHLMLIDLRPSGVSGDFTQDLLDEVGITVNKNAIPFDDSGPFNPGGIRLGTCAVTTRGMLEKDIEKVADFIHEAISNKDSKDYLTSLRERVYEFNQTFPLPS